MCRLNCRLSWTISIHAPHAGSDFVVTPNWFKKLISIHAPHAGSDLIKNIIKSFTISFQSTLPMRGATPSFLHPEIKLEISIHAPHAGSDGNRRGCGICKNRFQSTLPMRGATKTHPLLLYAGLFQSTLPMRGATWGLGCKR